MTTQPHDLKKLREVALAATPGPWSRNIPPASHYPTIFAGRNTHVLALTATNKQVEANAEFVTTFNPQTILALLDAYEASAKDAERYRFIRDQAGKSPQDFAVIEDAAFTSCHGDVHNFDMNIDEAIAARHATQGD